MRRTGIDLSSFRCNVVDAESSGRGPTGEAAAFRVHHFASITHLDGTETLTRELKTLAAKGSFSRRAWVNLWDVRSSHQYLLLPMAPASELESRARHHGASALGMSDLDVTISTSIGGTRSEPGRDPKREVSFFAAGSADIRERLRPIADAGFLIEGVTTPCGALWSEARLRRVSVPGEVCAHIAIGALQSALGIFADGALLYARDFDWGYASQSNGVPATQDREVLANRVSTELRWSFLYLKQYWEQDVSQLLLCGDMSELRSLTAPLIERLNIEVETLDTLEGIDAASLPNGFAESAATLRLASSIAVEPPPVNLLPLEVTANRASRSARRVLAVGTAAAVAFGAFLYARADAARDGAEQERETVRSEIPVSPEAQKMERAPLEALDAQGPTMARLLEALGTASPQGVTLRSLRALPDGLGWSVSVDAFAVSRQAGDRFVGALSASPMFGDPIGTPTLREVPAGGVAVAASFRVRK